MIPSWIFKVNIYIIQKRYLLGVERLGGGTRVVLAGGELTDLRGESSVVGFGRPVMVSCEWKRAGELPNEISESMGGGLLETEALRE